MFPDQPKNTGPDRQILGRVTSSEFVGRTSELDRIIRLASGREFLSGALIAAQPGAGASEVLRQAFDALFQIRDKVTPLYFSVSSKDKTVQAAAQQFLNAALVQYIAYRRNDASLCSAVLSQSDLLELAPPGELDWIERLTNTLTHEGKEGTPQSIVRSCLSVFRRMRESGAQPFLLLDDAHESSELAGGISLTGEFSRAVLSSGCGFVFSGLRRVVMEQFGELPDLLNNSVLLKVEQLDEDASKTLFELTCRRVGVTLNDQTRDLVVQELNGNARFLSSFAHAAADSGVSLNSFRDCQQVYVNEVMGGRLGRYFNSIFERLGVSFTIQRNLTKVLFESGLLTGGKIGIDILRRRLDVESPVAQAAVNLLQTRELVTFSSSFIEVNPESLPWTDYLRSRYRLEVAGQARALVFADTLLEVLKRAPQTMARHYRRGASLRLDELLRRFNCQRVPASLLHYDRFKRDYKGAPEEEILAGLEAEAELVRLPQVVHVASCSAFDPAVNQSCDEERCAVAHSFESASYSDTNEIIWLSVEIESKLEVGRGIAEIWTDRLEDLGRSCGFSRTQLWLVAPEGFSDDAITFLNERRVYTSSNQQIELLSKRLDSQWSGRADTRAVDEFEMVIPMGEDSEIIAANTIEQIARRVNFQSEAINQIKTALVEACINASEHSLSPDRKIYQQIRVESDKLVVTVSSRGVAPVLSNGPGQQLARGRTNGSSDSDATKGRRGWGLKLIKSLMDEVEFEAVDDGTRLRMTKYLRKQ
jgi:serine/threonine-protein kinase RsbW